MGTINKVAFVKFIFNVWKDKIMPALSEVHAPGGLDLTVKRW